MTSLYTVISVCVLNPYSLCIKCGKLYDDSGTIQFNLAKFPQIGYYNYSFIDDSVFLPKFTTKNIRRPLSNAHSFEIFARKSLI